MNTRDGRLVQEGNRVAVYGNSRAKDSILYFGHIESAGNVLAQVRKHNGAVHTVPLRLIKLW